jgi:hypothetical protein
MVGPCPRRQRRWRSRSPSSPAVEDEAAGDLLARASAGRGEEMAGPAWTVGAPTAASSTAGLAAAPYTRLSPAKEMEKTRSGRGGAWPARRGATGPRSRRRGRGEPSMGVGGRIWGALCWRRSDLGGKPIHCTRPISENACCVWAVVVGDSLRMQF